MKPLRTLSALLLLALVVGGCNPARMEDLIADLEGTWHGVTLLGMTLDLRISQNGSTIGNYGSYYFTGQASLYGTQFELTSIDIDMSGQYTAESERLDGYLYDYRDPDVPVEDQFTVFRVKE
ncbi:MAG TPA: hypothetical protein VM054_01135 [bacterium]|nr:hypothetical protein [bacterium]